MWINNSLQSVGTQLVGMPLTGATSEPTLSINKEDILKWFIGTPIKILLILLCSVAIWFVCTRIINRVTRRLVNKADTDRQTVARRTTQTSDLTQVLMAQRRRARAEAIASLLRSMISITVAGISGLLVLAQLNINITPLLASAGVLGVALGFGAQSMVKDYLSGIFLIMEDQYGVGDVVDLGPVVGTVEDVTLRVTRVRDMSGVVWYVRNGEVLRVANRSQGWTLAIVDVPIAYNEDLEKVRELVEAVANDMDTDPQYDEMLLGKPMFAGVESVTGEAVYVRVTAKSAPEQQIAVTRALRERLKTTFDRAGVRAPILDPLQRMAATAPEAGSPASPTPPPAGQPPTKQYGTGPLKP